MSTQNIFTFKTRRKMNILLTLALSIIFIHSATALPLCPHYCECYKDDIHSLRTASCNSLYWDEMSYPNIKQLKLRRALNNEPCHLFNFTSLMFPKLSRLVMNDCELTDVPSLNSNNFTELIALELAHNEIRSINPDSFLPYPKLLVVILESNPLSSSNLPYIRSPTIRTMNLNSCGLKNIPPNVFKDLPNFKYLFLSGNLIKRIKPNTLPDQLISIDLSSNRIVNVPTSEFIRLEKLRKINMFDNPTNCSCSLMSFQNYLSSRLVFFDKGFSCSHPAAFAGRRLNNIPVFEICDSQVLTESLNMVSCTPDHICSKGIVVNQNRTSEDENKAALEEDEVILADKTLIPDDSMQMDDSGSGDGDGTDMPVKRLPTTITTLSTLSTTNASETTEQTTSTSSNGIIKVQTELNLTSEVKENAEMPVENSTSPSEKESTTNVVTETTSASFGEGKFSVHNKSALDSALSENSEPHLQLQERLQHDSAHREMFGYLIPALAVLFIGLICLAVYCSQCASKMGTYKSKDANVEGTELQEVSLLSSKTHPTIVKHTDKYPNEKESPQTEKLMNEYETNEVNGNASQHSDDTIDCCKLSNGQSVNQTNGLGNVECTVVKVTTLPDSVPQTAVIRSI